MPIRGTPDNYLGTGAYVGRSWYLLQVVRQMNQPYTIVLWCADTTRFASMVAAHLLNEGIVAANRGRIDDEIPMAIGVANTGRWPVFSREVAAGGILRHRRPRVSTVDRHDFLLTLSSGFEVDARFAPRSALPVIDALQLAHAFEAVTPSALNKNEVLKVLNDASRPSVAAMRRRVNVDVNYIADTCQRLVSALAR